MLLAAGYAPRYSQLDLDAEPMRAARDRAHPAARRARPVSRASSSTGSGTSSSRTAPPRRSSPASRRTVLAPRVNVFRVCLHPDGLAARTAELRRLGRRTCSARSAGRSCSPATPSSPRSSARSSRYPGLPDAGRRPDVGEWSDPPLLVPFRLALGDVEVSLFTTLTTFGTPRDVTLDELAVELFFPADDASERDPARRRARRPRTVAVGTGGGGRWRSRSVAFRHMRRNRARRVLLPFAGRGARALPATAVPAAGRRHRGPTRRRLPGRGGGRRRHTAARRARRRRSRALRRAGRRTPAPTSSRSRSRTRTLNGNGRHDDGEPFQDCPVRRVDGTIAPPDGRWDGIYLGGGDCCDRQPTAVLDPIWARTIVVDNGDRRVVDHERRQRGRLQGVLGPRAGEGPRRRHAPRRDVLLVDPRRVGARHDRHHRSERAAVGHRPVLRRVPDRAERGVDRTRRRAHVPRAPALRIDPTARPHHVLVVVSVRGRRVDRRHAGGAPERQGHRHARELRHPRRGARASPTTARTASTCRPTGTTSRARRSSSSSAAWR